MSLPFLLHVSGVSRRWVMVGAGLGLGRQDDCEEALVGLGINCVEDLEFVVRLPTILQHDGPNHLDFDTMRLREPLVREKGSVLEKYNTGLRHKKACLSFGFEKRIAATPGRDRAAICHRNHQGARAETPLGLQPPDRGGESALRVGTALAARHAAEPQQLHRASSCDRSIHSHLISSIISNPKPPSP